MRNYAVFAVLIVFTAIVSGCSAVPVTERQPISVPNGVTLEQVEAAIISEVLKPPPPVRGGLSAADAELVRLAQQSHEWVLEARRAGEIEASVSPRSHYLKVLIVYSATTVRTEIMETRNLSSGEGTIHKNALVWIDALEKRIKASLGRALGAQQGAPAGVPASRERR